MITDKQRKQNILEQLEPLFKEAEEKKLWFYSRYQSMWFSPEELRDHHEHGTFIWGPRNWKLRDPEERLNELYEERKIINRSIRKLEKDIQKLKNA